MKKCIICEGEAEFVIKGTSDYYCKKHAEEYFGDISVLQTIEEQAQYLKDLIKERLDGVEDTLDTIDTSTIADKSVDKD
jgi:hypothetical protein